jgi:hypothetical protein
MSTEAEVRKTLEVNVQDLIACPRFRLGPAAWLIQGPALFHLEITGQRLDAAELSIVRPLMRYNLKHRRFDVQPVFLKLAHTSFEAGMTAGSGESDQEILGRILNRLAEDIAADATRTVTRSPDELMSLLIDFADLHEAILHVDRATGGVQASGDIIRAPEIERISNLVAEFLPAGDDGKITVVGRARIDVARAKRAAARLKAMKARKPLVLEPKADNVGWRSTSETPSQKTLAPYSFDPLSLQWADFGKELMDTWIATDPQGHRVMLWICETVDGTVIAYFMGSNISGDRATAKLRIHECLQTEELLLGVPLAQPIPVEREKRLAAVFKQYAMLTEPKQVETRIESEAHMLQLLEDICQFGDAETTQFTLQYRHGEQLGEIDQRFTDPAIEALITQVARLHRPTGDQPRMLRAAKLLVRSPVTVSFQLRQGSGHETVEAATRIEAFLAAYGNRLDIAEKELLNAKRRLGLH